MVKTLTPKCFKISTYVFVILNSEGEETHYRLDVRGYFDGEDFYYTFGECSSDGSFHTGEKGHMRAYVNNFEGTHELRHKPERYGFEHFDFVFKPDMGNTLVELHYKGQKLILG